MSQATEHPSLPHYDNPPVVETVVGVQFLPLSGFSNAHLGAFWKCLEAEDWPNVCDVPPIPHQQERFAPEGLWGQSLRLQLTQDPSSRIQIRNRDNSRMLQVQNGRFHLNWLGEAGSEYPHYSVLREEFHSCLARFNEFIAGHQLGPIVPDQWEVTYVNHIPQVVWRGPEDWDFFRPLNAVPTIDGVIEAESFSGEWHFVIPGERGRLHVQWQHAKSSDSNDTEFIRLTMTARGTVESADDVMSSLFVGLDLGRSTIVQSFRSLMSETANKEWGLRDATRC